MLTRKKWDKKKVKKKWKKKSTKKKSSAVGTTRNLILVFILPFIKTTYMAYIIYALNNCFGFIKILICWKFQDVKNSVSHEFWKYNCIFPSENSLWGFPNRKTRNLTSDVFIKYESSNMNHQIWIIKYESSNMNHQIWIIKSES